MDKEIRLKRLYFRSVHRGSKETDIILSAYASKLLASLDDTALSHYETFLDESDNDIWDWVSGKTMSENPDYQRIITDLRECCEKAVKMKQR